MAPGTTERLTIESAGGVQLEASLHTPAGSGPWPGMVVCHPHPLYGGDMHNPVVEALCGAGLEAGYAVLRFNFRGAGGSSGVHDNGGAELDDVRAAASALAARPEVAQVDVLAGYSFGAMMALRAADCARALLLVSPPLGMGGVSEFPDVPLLALTGDRDEFVSVALLQEAAERRENAEVRLAEGADHFWCGHDAFLAKEAGRFLSARAALRA
jgi:alpha/beta superfamily hydrolase